MNIKPVGIFIALLGQILIACLFIFVIPVSLFVAPSVMWLDCCVVSLNYWLWMATIFTPPVNLNDPSGKQVAALGLRWQGSFIYSILSLGFIIFGLILSVGLKWQLIAQCFFIFLLLIVMYTVQGINSKTKSVHDNEGVQLSGKKSVNQALSRVVMEGEVKHIPADILDRLKKLNAECRYLAPSSAPQATALDLKITDCCMDLEHAFCDLDLNKDRIADLMHRLELSFSARRQY